MDISRENEGKIYVAAGDLEVHHGAQPYKPGPTPLPPQNYYHASPAPAQSPPSQHASTIQYNPVAPPPPPAKDVEEPKRIMGLRRPTFWLVIVLVLVVIVAAVGGGVGGSLAVENARKEALAQQAGAGAGSGTTPTPTATNSRGGSQSSTANASTATTPNVGTVNAAIVVPTVGLLPLQCPGLTGTSQTITFEDRSWTYDLSCGTDYSANDTVALVMYTLTDCLRACSSYNMNIDRYRPGTKKCVGIAFNKNLADSVRADFGTCWLKDTVASPVTKGTTDLVGAQLVAESG